MSVPIWQPQYDGYDLVPQVPYFSFDEFFALLRELKVAYYKLVQESVEGSNMQPRLVSFSGLLCIRCKLQDGGKSLFFKLTKGCGSAWCAAVNATLVSRMDCAARTYFFFHLQPGHDVSLGECKQFLLLVLKREIKLFLRDWDLDPFGYYPFTRKNFKYYASSQDVNTTTRALYMPIGKFQDIMAAFAMGTHRRLGGSDACLVRLLHNELVMYLFSWKDVL